MRVSSVCVSPMQQRSVIRKPYIGEPVKSPIMFKGLKFGDYVAGGICGTVSAIVTTAILGPIGGLIVGAITGKACADANNETRKDT